VQLLIKVHMNDQNAHLGIEDGRVVGWDAVIMIGNGGVE
jgi:hypothetical protein